MKNHAIVFMIGLAAVMQSPAAATQLRTAPSDSLAVEQLRPHSRDWELLLHAEDSRAPTADLLDRLITGTQNNVPEFRRIAVRALGRLERAQLVERIAPLLHDRDASVRATAAHALGQAVSRGDGQPARAVLLSVMATESEPVVLAAIAETLGRTRHADRTAAATTLRALGPMLRNSDPNVRLGAVRGMYFFTRQPNARGSVDAAIRAELLRIATSDPRAPEPLATRLRTLAAATLAAAAPPTAEALTTLLQDGNAWVRREAAAGILAVQDTAAARALLIRALRDPAATVRVEAVRVYGRRFGTIDCAPVLAASRDNNPHVALLAIDLLGRSCGDRASAIPELSAIARTLPASGDTGWHTAAHALVALAAAGAQSEASAVLPQFIAHPNFFVRTWAAEAAGLLSDRASVRKLAFDTHPNVRTAAIQGLSRIAAHSADSIYLAQLSESDNQLLMTAALALDSSTTRGVAGQVLDALDRVTALKRETMRDSRIAMLRTIGTTGDQTLANRLRPYLSDYDSAVAKLAAEILKDWTGAQVTPRPQPLAAQPLPTFEDVAGWVRATARIEMIDGGIVEVRLLPLAAPTNTARFVRLARAGAFDNTTFHRVVPNFVVQGGSPHANEYAGDGPFTRDELEAENWRGTIGLSTRGRDTGDGQIFINLIDNVRLDHDYTVFAEVVSGMAVVDRMLEGARIRRVLIID